MEIDYTLVAEWKTFSTARVWVESYWEAVPVRSTKEEAVPVEFFHSVADLEYREGEVQGPGQDFRGIGK